LASEIKAFAAIGIPLRWDERAVFHYQHYLSHPPGMTLFKGIQQVPPGHYLAASGTGMTLTPYWDFDYPTAATLASAPVQSDRDHAIALERKLEEAVRLRLEADVPVACYLSGGLDSSTIIGLAARHVTAPLRAFSVVFDSPEYEEGSIARET